MPVGELICIDQIPRYTVERFDSKQLLLNLNSCFVNTEKPKATLEALKAEFEGAW